MAQKVTVTTIAKEAGVSVGTVSYVLSGQAVKRNVAKDTAKRVTQIASDLHYVPNFWAQSMQTNRTGIISVLFHGMLMNWADEIMQGILEVLRPKHYTPIITLYDRMSVLKHDKSGIIREELAPILRRRDEGVICVPRPNAREDYKTLIRQGIPLVFIGQLLNDMTGLEEVSSVMWDNAPAVKTAVQHLINTGRRRIAFVGARHGVQSDNERFQAFENTLREAALPINEKWVVWGQTDIGVTAEMIAPMFSGDGEKPDAIFAINDSVAIELIKMLADLGIRVPDDVAVVGMGDFFVSAMSGIGLTTVQEPREEIGRGCAETVLELIKNPKRKAIHRTITCNGLKIRKTS